MLEAARSRPEWHAMVLVALRTGMRFGELSELRWDDADLLAGKVHVRRSCWEGIVGPTKGGRAREIPLCPETVRVLKELASRFRGELIFCKEDGGRRIHRRAEVMLPKLCRKAGLRRISWHVLRHSFASHLVMRNDLSKRCRNYLATRM